MDWIANAGPGFELAAPTRNFLFLQGVASGFFKELGRALSARGHSVRRVNFNGGDRLVWRGGNAIDYRGDLAGWPAFLSALLRDEAITDLVLFGDCRPLHAAAIKIAKANEIFLHIFEEGYFRPDWLTLESSGINGFSGLPRSIESYVHGPAIANRAPEHVPTDMLRRSAEDVAYTLANLAMRWRYPGYLHYRPYHPMVEYISGARRLLYRLRTSRRRGRRIASLIARSAPYYVWPMQIEVDSQISVHSQFNNVEEVIDQVMTSFARFAPSEATLVVTEHPLETSPRDWRQYVQAQAQVHGIGGRVAYLVNGSPDVLLASARGVVVINSTAGQKALELGVAVIALSRAVFNIAGLTFQDGLDRFWTEARPAGAETVAAYRQGVISRCQINGGLYSRHGIELAVRNAVIRIEEADAAFVLQATH